MKLEHQLAIEFSQKAAELILFMHDMGYQVILGDAYRDPRVTYGHPNSAHRKSLAIDLNLLKDGHYLDKTDDHKFFGKWWKDQHPLARWGGDFGDGNHYSFEFEGIK